MFFYVICHLHFLCKFAFEIFGRFARYVLTGINNRERKSHCNIYFN